MARARSIAGYQTDSARANDLTEIDADGAGSEASNAAIISLAGGKYRSNRHHSPG
jgi:hypothetical protein